MLFTQNLSISHNLTHHNLIQNLSFSMSKGDKIALIGEEGNGKSSLLKVLAHQDINHLTVSGQFHCDGKIGYLPQQLSYPGTVQEFLIEKCEFDFNNYQLLNQFNLSSDIFYSTQLFNSLSGGEKVKLTLLTLIINQTDTFLLDEPTNDLDLNTLRFLENFINQSNDAFLFISHDSVFIQNCGNRILLLEQTHRKTRTRHTLFTGKLNEFISLRTRQLTHQDQVARNQRQEHQQKIEKYRRIYEKVNYQLNTTSRQAPSAAKNLKDKMRSVKSMGKRFEKEQESFIEFSNTEEPINFFFDDVYLPKQKEILKLENLTLPLKNSKTLENINLNVKGQDKIGFTGENGIGKTTLLEEIVERLKLNNSINVGYMPQSYNEYLPLDYTPIDFLKNSQEKQELAKVSTLLGSMKFTAQEMTQTIDHLSGGQKAKLFLLKLMHNQYNVLLLDEPSRNLSPLSLPILFKALKQFNGCIIAISHDRLFLNQVTETVYQLNEFGMNEIILDEEPLPDLF